MKLPKQPPRHLDALLVHDGISMSVQDRRKFPERTVRTLISLSGCFGVLWCMQGFFSFPVALPPLLLFALGLTVLMRVIRAAFPRFGFGLILAAFASIPILLVRYREAAVAGSGAVYRIMRAKILWQKVFETAPVHVGQYSEQDCIRFIFDLTVIAMVALLEYSDVLLTHPQSGRSGFWIRFLVSFPFLECGLYFGLETSTAAVLLIILFWIGTLAVIRGRPSRREAIAQGRSYRLQHAFTSEIAGRYTTHESSAAVLLLLAAVLGAVCYAGTRGYVRSEKMLETRTNLRTWYRNFSFRDVTGLLSKIPTDLGLNVVSDEIDLMQENMPHFDGHTVLHVSAGTALPEQDYYLRALSRNAYTGRGWGLQTGMYRGTSRLFAQLADEEHMPQLLTHSSHLDDLRRAEDGKLPVVEMQVTALDPQTSVYIPYQALLYGSCRFRYDLDIELDNPRSYGFWMVTTAQPDWLTYAMNQGPSQSAAVNEYEEFVDKHYLDIPDTAAMNALFEDFRLHSPNPEAPLDMQLETIRQYIWERAEYTLSPAPIPADADFAASFLLQTHEGFCAHYASAAVLLCRMCGIPARYAQGYVIPQGCFAAYRGSSTYEIEIPDNQAHAWAEIYVKGYGWQPYEFTESVQESWHVPQAAAQTVTTTSATTTVTATSTTRSSTSHTSASTATTTAAVTSGAGGTESRMTPEQAARLRRTVLVLAGVLLAALLFAAWHYAVIRRRTAAMRSEDPNRAADASYGFLLRLLQMQKIRQEKRTHEDFAALVQAECDLLPAGRMMRVIAVQQQAAFSRSGIAAEDAALVRETALTLAERMYSKANPLKKLWLRWFRHIVK